jgi:hypothetical protein
MRGWWSALVLIAACSKSDPGKQEKPTEGSNAAGSAGSATAPGSATGSAAAQGSGSGSAASAETPRPPLPKFDVPGRLEAIGTHFDDSLALATKSGADAAKAKCGDLEPLYQPFCSEGIASAYLSKKGNAAKNFEATMAKIDPGFAPIDCQGIGFAIEDSPKVGATAKDLTSDTCRQSFWDGQGYYRALAGAGAQTTACRTEEGKAPDADACAKQQQAIVKADLVGGWCGEQKGKNPAPAGMDTSCAHGAGRAFVFMFNGEAKPALAACAGKNPQLVDACASGVGFVLTFLLPDRADVAFDTLGGLETRQKAAFARGMGRALSYWRHGDSKNLDNWLGSLSSTERKEAMRLADVHDKCATYFDLDKCEWQPK